MEVFKEIKGYEGLYEVSNRGNVKSLKRKNRLNEILLKIHLSTTGYPQVLLTKQGKSKTYQVHQLMAIAFLNHIPNGNRTVVDHIDNVKANNKLENLQITSHRNNSSKDTFRKNKTSKYIGVHWDEKRKKWRSSKRINGKKTYLGMFKTEIDAYEAYLKET